ncbi:MAG: DUF1461 domain-containing protein [Coriobacteriales bacterium]
MGNRSGQPLGALAAISSILGTIAIIACVLTLTFQVLLTPLPTHVFASWYVDDVSSPMDHDYLVQVAEQTLDYCNGNSGADLPYGLDDSKTYTPDVMSHLDDVTVFFSGMKLAAIVSVLVAMACIFALWVAYRERSDSSPARAGSRMMITAGVVILVLLAALVVWAIVDFYTMFNMLHSLFFSSGSWLFPYDSLLICALPEQFWMAMGVLWAAMIVVVCIVLIVVGLIVRRRYGASRLVAGSRGRI